MGQWLIAHGAGGRLIGGAVLLDDRGDSLGAVPPGEVIEVSVGGGQAQAWLNALVNTLRAEHLTAVPVGRLMQDAGAPV